MNTTHNKGGINAVKENGQILRHLLYTLAIMMSDVIRYDRKNKYLYVPCRCKEILTVHLCKIT